MRRLSSSDAGCVNMADLCRSNMIYVLVDGGDFFPLSVENCISKSYVRHSGKRWQIKVLTTAK